MLKEKTDRILEVLLNSEAEWLNILQRAWEIRHATKHGKARVKNAAETLRVIRVNILKILGS